MRNSIIIIFCLGLLVFFNQDAIAQYSPWLNINTNALGTYKARDQVAVTIPGGHVTANSTNDSHLYLDKTLQFYAGYLPAPPTVGNIRPLDQTLKPGSIKGSHSVDLSGSFNYNIPIQLPPGTNNMAPTLSLAYNSNGGNNTLGMGWGISGLSIISRTSKDLFHDGTKSNIDFNTTGPFSLDGNRLVFQSANGNGENFFYTESESFSQITLKNQNSQGQQYFEVKTKNGLTMIYGNTSDSKATIPFSGRTLPALGAITNWYLNKVIDNYGNYMEYSYFNTASSTMGSDVAIKEIKYTGNTSAGFTPYNSVKFYYDLKTNPQTQYLIGDQIDRKLILREISVFTEQSPLMPCFNYSLSYTNGEFDFLNEVIFSANGESLNSTVFIYGPTPASRTTVYSTSLPLNADYSSLDLNGDGLSDLIAFMYNYVHETYGTKTYDSYRVYMNAGSVGGNQLFNLTQTETGNFTFSNPTNIYTGITSVKNSFLLADVIGDAVPEIIYSKLSGSNINDVFVGQFNPGTNQFQNANYGTSVFQVRNATMGANISSTPNDEVLSLSLGDFDSDGKAEMVTFWKNTTNSSYEFQYFDFNDNISLKKTDNTSPQQQYSDLQNISHSLYDFDSFSAFDFNGDGRCDLLGKKGSSSNLVFVDMNVNKSSSSISLNELYESNMSLSHSLAGDYNGDGYMDFALEFLTHVDVSYGTGTSLTTNTLIGNYNRNSDIKRIPMDINNDGKADLVELFSDTQNQKIFVNVADGSKFSTNFYNISEINGVRAALNNDDEKDGYNDRDYVVGVGPGDLYSQDQNKIPAYEVGDFNGDGMSDLLLKVVPYSGVSEMRIVCFNELSNEKYLTNIYDGNDNMLQVEYFRLSNASRMAPPAVLPTGCTGAGYSKSSTAPSYPLTNATLPVNVVGYVSDLTDGQNEGFREAYYYTNGVSHMMGKGFLGFDKVVKKTRAFGSSSDVFQSTQEFDLYSTYFVRKPTQSKEEFISGSTIKIFSTTTFNSTLHVYDPTLSSLRYFPEITSVSTVNNYINSTTSKAYAYDYGTGNITSETTNVGPGTELTQKIYSNFTTAGSWLSNNVPQSESIAISKSGESTFTRNRSFGYDAATGAILTSSEEPGAVREVLTTNVYDTNTGVLRQSTTTAPQDNSTPAPAPIPVYYDYDSKSRFVEKMYVSSIGMGYYNETKSDAVYGNKIYSKDNAGLLTQFTYDNFGTLTEKIDPDGQKTKYSNEWFSSSSIDPQDVKPVSTTIAKFMSSVESPDGKKETTITDRFGKTLKIESNTFNGGKYSTLMQYNSKGELYKEFGPYLIPLPSGKAVIEKTNTYAADIGALTGQLTSDGSVNLTSSVTYNFNTTMKETAVTTTGPDNKSKTETTDQTGRLIKVLDNNSNLLEYEYHYDGANSVFVNKTKLNGTVVLTKKTDNFNHLTEETELNGGTKLYSVNAFGQVKSMTDSKNTQYLFDYDVLGRLTTKSIGSDYYHYIYNYGGLGKGQLAEININNANAYKYTYDDLGRTKQVEEYLDGKSFITSYDYNQLGQVVKETQPNNFALINEYANGELIKIKNGQNNTLIWQLDELDNTGAIRKYTLGNNIQTVNNFDNFGFSTNSTSGGVQNLAYNYNTSNGNLNSVIDNISGNTESYVYDNLDRLITITNANYSGNLSTTYDAIGNISTKYDAGTYTYHGTKQNQVIEATNVPDQINHQQQDVSFNAFDKVSYLSEGNNTADIFYDAAEERYKTVFRISSAITNTRYYLNGMERNIAPNNTVTDINYVETPSGLCAMQVTDPTNGPSMKYIYTDFVGSIVAATDNSGSVISRQGFDAWGRRRDPVTQSYTSITSVPTWLTRGYTGHEHLPDFTLINMNGRMYDPVLSRMLSVDPVLTDALNSQDYNKYSYARNNPLKYTDPSGYSVSDSKLYDIINAPFTAQRVLTQNSAGSLMGDSPSEKNAEYSSTFSSRIPMSSVNTGPGKNDVGDWMENIVYSSTYKKWEPTLARNKFDDGKNVYEQGGPIAGTIEEQSPGHWIEANKVSNYYMPGGPGELEPIPRTKVLKFTIGLAVGTYNGVRDLLVGTKDYASSLATSQRWQSIGTFWRGALDHDMESMDWDRWENNYNEAKNFAVNANSYEWGYGIGYYVGPALLSEGASSVYAKAFGIGGPIGPIKNWARVGNSYSQSQGIATYGLRWGAGGKYWKNIGNPTFQKWNKSFRTTKLPFPGWRSSDAGHFHFWKK